MVLFEVMEENLRTTMAIFARANPKGETRRLDGVAVASSGVQFPMFNSALLTAPVASAAELDRRVKLAAGFFAAHRLPWSFWVCQGWIAREARSSVGGVLDCHRLHLVVELPGMIAGGVTPARPLPALEFRRVSDPATRADFSHIMTMAFGLPAPVARAIYESECTWSGGFVGWLAYEDGVAVSSTATMSTPSATGVYAVGTLPSHRNRGCAEAVMRHAVTQAQAAGATFPLVLQSSEAGYAMYQRMGYQTATRYAVFAT